jgi:hypothetical protein
MGRLLHPYAVRLSLPGWAPTFLSGAVSKRRARRIAREEGAKRAPITVSFSELTHPEWSSTYDRGLAVVEVIRL